MIQDLRGSRTFILLVGLCMACSLSTKDGEGLGTLGFTVPVASQMTQSVGFENIRVILEEKNVRWFLVQ